MEYYFYILVVVALFLKLGLYFCWYHMRRRAAMAREVQIVMPDGTTRRAVVTGRTTRRNRREDRQILAHSDTLQHSDNQGFEERPAYPHVMTGNAPVGAFPEPPPYSGIISGVGSTAGGEWKLPKYEDLPPPYTNAFPTETGCSASEVPSVPIPSGPQQPPIPEHSTTPTPTPAPYVPSPAPAPSSLPPPPHYTAPITPNPTTTDEQLVRQGPHQTITIDSTSESSPGATSPNS